METTNRLKIHVQAPVGNGSPPPNRIEYALAYPGENVTWQLDANGWAVGYQAWKAETQAKQP